MSDLQQYINERLKTDKEFAKEKMVNTRLDCQICEELIFLNTRDGRWYTRIENNHWNDWVDGYDYQDIEINFCYDCGKDYRE